MDSNPGELAGAVLNRNPNVVDAADFMRPEDDTGRFDHAYLGRLTVLRWAIAFAYLSLVVSGALPVQFWGFVASAIWFGASNVVGTWVWMQKRPIQWHDRYYIFVDLVTVVLAMVAVANMAYPVWLTLNMLMLSAAAEQRTKIARVFNATCIGAYLATVAFLAATGWHSPNVPITIVTAVVLGLVAAHVSITFEGNRRLRGYIRHMAVTDPLTHIANRRSLSRLLASPPTTGHSLAVAILDVDRFKQYNDEFGHLAGDKLLVSIAETLTEAFPEAEMVSRYGGDEFVVVLAANSSDEVTRTFDRVLNQRPSGGMGVSVGVALWPDEQPTLDSALAEADERLRAAKRGKRGLTSRLRASNQPSPRTL